MNHASGRRRLTQLVVDMTGLSKELGIADAIEFQEQFGIPRARIDQLEDDTWIHISKEHLLILLTLAQQVGKNFQFLQVIDHPLWTALKSGPVQGFIGHDLEGSLVDHDLSMLGRFGSSGIRVQQVRPVNTLDVTATMRSQNCLMIGSPKCNEFTEAALEALWPGDGEPPLRFRWPAWPDGRTETRFTRPGSPSIEYVDHRGNPQLVKDASPHRPVGALIVCPGPLGTQSRVTTVIIAGATRDGTSRIVEDLMTGAINVRPSQLKQNHPSLFILKGKARGVRWYNLDGERDLKVKQKARREARKAARHNRE